MHGRRLPVPQVVGGFARPDLGVSQVTCRLADDDWRAPGDPLGPADGSDFRDHGAFATRSGSVSCVQVVGSMFPPPPRGLPGGSALIIWEKSGLRGDESILPRVVISTGET